MTNARAEALFERAGVKYVVEPGWIEEGQRPDFFCSGRAEFWCEVKTLGPPNDFRQLNAAFDELTKRVSSITSPGRGLGYVGEEFNQRDAKALVGLLERSLRRLVEARPERAVALVPCDPDYSRFVRFSISTEEFQTVEFHSCLSRTGKYGGPFGFVPHPYGQATLLYFDCGEVREVLARKILTLKEDFRAAIEVWPHSKQFSLISATTTGVGKRLNNAKRIREAVAEANRQFKNALNYRAASSPTP